MGVSTHDIFGDGTPLPAPLGSYGQAPEGYRLPSDLSLGPVHLQVGDLPRSVDYYQETLGLRTLDRTTNGATFGTQEGDTELVRLTEKRGASPAPRRGRLGLFHFAILLPDRPSLGRFVRHLGEIGTQAGAADHLVSEAFYLQDPDNLGIEVYHDRPRDSWHRRGRELMMATDPVDAEGIVAAAGETRWEGMPAGTRMGHLHLHVGDLATAQQFYSEGLGFNRTVWDYPGALFMAAGGYHHHLGTNTWAGTGAKGPGPEDAQLLEWTMRFPERESLELGMANVARSGGKPERQDRTVLLADPWGDEGPAHGTVAGCSEGAQKCAAQPGMVVPGRKRSAPGLARPATHDTRDRTMRTTTSVLFLASIGVAPLAAQAHDFTPYLIADRGEEVALARSAAPPTISDSASVYVMTDTGYVEVAKGTNGFTCFVIRSLINSGVDSATTWQPQLRAPHCFNPQATRTALPNILYRTRSLLRGVPAARIEAGVRAAYASHRWPTSEVGAMVYMLSPRQWLSGNNTDWSSWKPHLMFFLPPGHAPRTWGALQQGNANLIDAGPNPYGPGNLVLVPVEQWSDGTPYGAPGNADHQH